jgi:hypothetical protein
LASFLDIKHGVTSKYEGLRRIEVYGLPHPSWRFVRSHEDIPRVPWINAPHGWTIRCCPQDRYEFGLPSKHRLDYEQLPSTLQILQKETGISHFVVYPSWEFEFSGSFLLTPECAYIEVVVGDIEPLLKGQQIPDVTYYGQGPYYTHLTLIAGKQEILCSSEKVLFLRVCRRIMIQRFTVLEWTKTTEGEVLFHDFLEFVR